MPEAGQGSDWRFFLARYRDRVDVPRSKNLSRFIHENYLRGGHHKAALWNRPVPQGIVGRNLHEPVMSGLNLKAPTLAERWVADLEVIMFEVQVADLPVGS